MADGLQAAATVRSGDTIKLAIPTASGTYAYEARPLLWQTVAAGGSMCAAATTRLPLGNRRR